MTESQTIPHYPEQQNLSVPLTEIVPRLGQVLAPDPQLWKEGKDLPLGITLWGMTNTGKSTLLKEIFNFAHQDVVIFPSLVEQVRLILRCKGLFLELFEKYHGWCLNFDDIAMAAKADLIFSYLRAQLGGKDYVAPARGGLTLKELESHIGFWKIFGLKSPKLSLTEEEVFALLSYSGINLFSLSLEEQLLLIYELESIVSEKTLDLLLQQAKQIFPLDPGVNLAHSFYSLLSLGNFDRYSMLLTMASKDLRSIGIFDEGQASALSFHRAFIADGQITDTDLDQCLKIQGNYMQDRRKAAESRQCLSAEIMLCARPEVSIGREPDIELNTDRPIMNLRFQRHLFGQGLEMYHYSLQLKEKNQLPVAVVAIDAERTLMETRQQVFEAINKILHFVGRRPLQFG